MASTPASNFGDLASSQTNFNPSWMPQKATNVKMEKPESMYDDEKTCDPIFSKYSYGREDLLALNKIDTNKKPPKGIEKCIFFTGEAQEPMLLLPYTDGELKVNNNINSSKAVSAHGYGRSERSTNGSENTATSAYRGGGNQYYNNRRFNDQQQNNRWSALGSVSSNKPWKNYEKSREKPAEIPSNSASFDTPTNNVQQNNLPISNNLPPELNNNKQAETNNVLSDRSNQTFNAKQHVEITQNHTRPPNESPGFSTDSSPPKWIYLDPSGIQRGPFESEQMQAWYSSGYFNQTLRLSRVGDSTFVSLGDLIQQNGAVTPFIDKSPQKTNPSVIHGFSDPNSSVLQQRLVKQGINTTTSASSGDILVDSHISPKLVDMEKIWGNPVVDDALKDKERKLMEEQRRLREKEELLRQEEREREEKERRMMEMELEINRKKDELARLAREKEREIELKCLQLAEYERKRKEELELLEQKIKQEQLQQQIRKAEEDRRRAFEMEEILKKEQERQRQLMEAEGKRIREEEEARLRQIALQEAQRIAALRIEEENKQKEEHQRKLNEEKQRETLRRAAEEKAKASRSQQSEAPLIKPTYPIKNEKKPAWNINPSQKMDTPPLEWTFPEEPTPVKSQTKIATEQQQPRTWNQIKTPIPAPIPAAPISKVPNKQPPIAKTSKQPRINNHDLKQQDKMKNDQFTGWIIKRVREMNSDVDAEVFASFIEGIDSPNEVEDYIVGYLGDSKNVRDFHREFLQKRIEERPRVNKAAKKDDLSRPAVALTDVNDKNAFQNVANSKDKKKKKPQKVLDPKTLGFRPSGDPNRINAGEIDITPPAPQTIRKKR